VAGMAEVLADTSSWAAFLVRTEAFHALAESLMRQWQANGARVITTNDILAELAALFIKSASDTAGKASRNHCDHQGGIVGRGPTY
jgi:predicted nucleic acid-binding protein